MSTGDEAASFWARLFRCGSEQAVFELLRSGAATRISEDDALAAWRAHDAATARTEARYSARSRDLDALESFGRALAEARTPEDLLVRAGDALSRLLDLDAAAFASALPERTQIDVLLARPLAGDGEAALRRVVARGFLPGDTPAGPARRLPAFDAYQGARAPFADEDVLVVPVGRRGRESMRIAVLPSAAGGERALRLLFGASNHLALHLDRVLAVHAAEQGRFRAILDSMPHAVVLTDASFAIVQSNASAERLLAAWGRSEALRSVGDLDLVALAYDVLSGRRAEAEGDAALPDGTALEVSIAPWRVPSGTIDGLVVVMLDVTTARRLREQIVQSEKLSSLGRMIAGVAHEINNPLTSVIGYAQLLRSAPPGPRTEQRLDTIRKEAERCRRIVQNLLRFARTHPPERRPFSLNEVAETVAQLLAYPVRSSGSRIELALDRAIPAVLGDAHAVEQAVVNLVNNAQQALAGAGREGAIVLRTRADSDGRPVLEVADDGPGIPEPLRARIFDPFFTTKPVGQGTGLGLWLVYNAVHAQGGRIEVGSSASGGALFRMSFVDAGAPAVGEGIAAADPFEHAPKVSARILVLDAEVALAGLICEALEEEGYAAVAAHDAGEAIAQLEHDPFDLVVADLALPGLPGERLARELARVRPGAPAAMLLTSGDWVGREPEEAARRMGADLLRKPFELDDLRRVVRSRLARRAEH
jgi:signal transduction histidine kinase/ActR/RegA family two-component response regulator